MRTWIWLWLVFQLGGVLFAGADKTANPSGFKWMVGEDLVYKVKYSFLTIATLRIQVLSGDSLNGRQVYHCRMHIKSNSRVPFVDIDDTFESVIDEELYSHRFRAKEKFADYWLHSDYRIDYTANRIFIHCEKHFPDRIEVLPDSTAYVPERVQDGLSMLFFARAHAPVAGEQDVAVFALKELRSTFIHFSGRMEEVKARGVHLGGHYLDGQMKFVGIAGIKEDFKGWFSPDAQRIPLHARMKAVVGSIRLNLESWVNWEGERMLVSQ